jgi:hypothetical protein
MKTNELRVAALDWAVAEAEGFFKKDMASIRDGKVDVFYFDGYEPSNDWALGGAIKRLMDEAILRLMANPETPPEMLEQARERERISIENVEGLYWTAGLTHRDEEYGGWRRAYAQGDTPLEAAMRCYVASKLGNEVEIPEGMSDAI